MRDTIRTVLGINGEPATPTNPAKGLVWRAICQQIDQPGSVSRWVSAGDSSRGNFEKHPWSIGGGGASELKEKIEEVGEKTLLSYTEIRRKQPVIGFGCVLGEDEVFQCPRNALPLRKLPADLRRPVVEGDLVRDWGLAWKTEVLFPYTSAIELRGDRAILDYFWSMRTSLGARNDFSKQTYKECGRPFWEYHQIPIERNQAKLLITLGEISTHNHFVLDHGGKVFKQTAPIIKLKPDATETDHIRLLGVLNSSAACFWLKQVCHNKGSTVDEHGARQRTAPFEDFYAFNGTTVANLPIPAYQPTQLPVALVAASTELQSHAPAAVLAALNLRSRAELSTPETALSALQTTLPPAEMPFPPSQTPLGTVQMPFVLPKVGLSASQTGLSTPPTPLPPSQTELSASPMPASTPPTGLSTSQTPLSPTDRPADLPRALAAARTAWHSTRQRMISSQEELDWQIYAAFGLVEAADDLGLPEGDADSPDAAPPIAFGERAFEFVLARRMAGGEEQTTWFERHGAVPQTDLPARWPAAYRARVERRIARIAADANIRLIERPEYKRRWNTEPWDDQLQRAARDSLLARLEGYFHEGERVCELTDGFSPAAQGFTAATRPHLATANELADVAQTDRAFLEVAESYVGSSGFSVPKLVRELVEGAAVPYLPAQRYKESGLRKRRDWEHVWALQRREDAMDAEEKVDEAGISDIERARRQTAAARKKADLGDIPVPPKYVGADFIKATYWKLRGKLDVPKERWVSYPGAERAGDESLLIAWAGWDHLQQAQALAEYYLDAKDNQGWQPDRLRSLLAGLAELIPWLKQWHNAPDPNLGMGLGDYFAGFLDEQCHGLGLTVVDVNRARFGDTPQN